MTTRLNRIVSVTPLDGLRLEVHYQNGPPIVVDCAELPERFAVFAP